MMVPNKQKNTVKQLQENQEKNKLTLRCPTSVDFQTLPLVSWSVRIRQKLRHVLKFRLYYPRISLLYHTLRYGLLRTSLGEKLKLIRKSSLTQALMSLLYPVLHIWILIQLLYFIVLISPQEM